MLKTNEKLGELARIIKAETCVSLDISECGAVVDFCASSCYWDLDDCIENLDSENNFYGTSNKLFIVDNDKNIANDIISWGVREMVAYRNFTNLNGYSHINDMWEKLDIEVRIKHLIALGLELYKTCGNLGEALEAIQESYLDAGMQIFVDMKNHNNKSFVLVKLTA